MNLSRRSLLKAAVGMPAAAWLLNYRALAAPFAGQVKITNIKTMGLDNVADGCLIRIETDAGIVGYGEAGLPSAAARARVDMMVPQLIGQDPFGQPRAGHDPPRCRLTPAELRDAARSPITRLSPARRWVCTVGRVR